MYRIIYHIKEYFFVKFYYLQSIETIKIFNTHNMITEFKKYNSLHFLSLIKYIL
jgi:hypothetical protein